MTSPLDPQEITTLAGKLTKAQRGAFLRSADDNMHPSNAGRISTYGDVAVGYQLFELGLTQRSGTFSPATPLGLAVRAALLEKDKEA